MSINNSLIIKQSQSIEIIDPLIEEHYQIQYNINNINTTNYIKSKYKISFLPQIRELITEELLDVEIFPNENRIVQYDSSHDICYDLDNIFNEDTVYVSMTILLSDLIKTKNVMNYLYISFYINYLNIINNSELYDLSMNLCQISIHTGELEMSIFIKTYPAYVMRSIDKVIDWITNTNLDQISTIEIIKEQMVRNTENMKQDEPYIKLMKITSDTFTKNFTHTVNDILSSIDSIDYSKIASHAKKLLSRGNIKCVISGNVNNESSIEISNKINSMFTFNDFNITDFTNNIDTSSSTIVNNENNQNENSACKIIYVLDGIQYGVGDWATSTCLISILSTIIHTEYFHQLRTLGKLGYIVFSHKINMNNPGTLQKKGIALIVQSDKLNASQLCDRSINALNNEIKNKLINLDSKEFINIKLGLLSNLKTPETNIYSRINEITNAIDNKTPNREILFNYKEHLISALIGNNPADIISSGITKEHVIDYFNTKFIDNPIILSLGVQSTFKS